MNTTRLLTSVLLCILSLSPRAGAQSKDYSVGSGCVVRARAYIDNIYPPRGSSRFDLELVRASDKTSQWDFTLSEDPNDRYAGGLEGGISPVPYGRKRYALIHASLHRYDTYEERVTFKNLDLGPLTHRLFGQPFPENARYLALKQPMTVTTPSGIALTLPAQGAETLEKVFANFDGNANALFIQIRTSPNSPLASVPGSPLFKKYGKPVRIKLDCPEPNFMTQSAADNTFQIIAVSRRDLKTLTHLDTLTLIVRQRVDLQTIPLTLRVPVTRPQD